MSIVAILATWGLAAIAAITARRSCLAHDELCKRFMIHAAPYLTVVPATISIILITITFMVASHAYAATTSTIMHVFMWPIAIMGIAFVVQMSTGWMLIRGTKHLASTHLVIISYIYACASCIPVIVLSVIVSFMMAPGLWLDTFNIWDTIFTPMMVPLFVTASSWGIITGTALFMFMANTLKQFTPAERNELEARTRTALLLAAIAVPYIPLLALSLPSTDTALPIALGFGLVFSIAALAFIVIARFVRKEHLGFTGALVTAILALAAIAAVTQSFAGFNAPYTIRGYIFRNGISAHDAHIFKRQGILTHATSIVPQGVNLARTEPKQLGRWIFLANGYDCCSSHTHDQLAALARTLGVGKMRNALLNPGSLHLNIPPFAGTPQELDDLIAYLTEDQEETP